MRTLLCMSLWLAICASPAIRPQVTVAGKADTVVGTHAALGSSSILKTFPQDTTFTQSSQLSATVDVYNSSLASVTFSGLTSFAVAASGGALGGPAQSGSSNTTRSNGKPESFLVSFLYAGAPATGRLLVRIDGHARVTDARYETAGAWANVTVGSTVLKWTAPNAALQHDLPVTIGPTGLAVRIEAYGHAGSSQSIASYAVTARVDFFPGSCTVLPYGQPNCASLTGSLPAPRTLRLELRNAVPRAPVLCLAGVKKVNLWLRPALCYLLVDPIVILGGYVTDSSGTCAHSLDIPLGTGQILLQDIPLSLSGPQWLMLASSGVELTCTG